MSDVNLFSFYSPSSDNVSLDWRSKEVGKLTNPDWSDSLKYTSKLTNFHHYLGVVFGGKEDCCDFNNECNGVVVEAESFWSQGKYVATIKGGCTGIMLSGTITRGGNEVDIDLGNWSDQSTKKTTGVRLSLNKAAGPVRVRVLNADVPLLEPETGPYEYIFPKPGTWYHGICVWFILLWHRVF